MSSTVIENLLSELELKGALETFKSYTDDPTKLDSTPVTLLLETMLTNELNQRRYRKQTNLLKVSGIPQNGSPIDIRYDEDRDDAFKNKMTELLTLDFVNKAQNLTIFGNAGSGKTYIACVLARLNCMQGNSTHFCTTRGLIDSLAVVKGSAAYRTKVKIFAGKSLLVMDDFCLTEYSAVDKEILFDILDARYQRKSTLIISQKTPNLWLEILGNDSLAESIVERASTFNHTLTLLGQSRRKSID